LFEGEVDWNPVKRKDSYNATQNFVIYNNSLVLRLCGVGGLSEFIDCR
jgi:hypothetical protein